MSKIFISTVNCGKAHDADIYGVTISNPFTVTCSGDGFVKLWFNNLLDNETPKERMVSQFVHKTGVHHVDIFHSVERTGVEFYIISCVSFSGEIFFYSVNTKNGEMSALELLTKDEMKKSFWAVKWLKSDDKTLNHRFAATDVKGNTYIWKFHPFEQEIDDVEEMKKKLAKEKADKRRTNNRNTPNKDEDNQAEEIEEDQGPIAVKPHLVLQGVIEPSAPNFATAIDMSIKGLIATGFSSGSVVIAQLTTLRPIYTFEGFGIQGIEQNSNTVRALKFSPTGNLLAAANDSGSYGCVSLFETDYGERVGDFTVPSHSNQASIGSYAHSGWVFDLSFNPTGNFLATCGYDSKVRVWDVKTKERVSTLNLSADDIENEEEILLEDELGDSLKRPPVMGVTYIDKGVRSGLGNDTNEGLACVCLDRSVRWFREAGGS
ncbi:hypothetical protein TPHA_0A05850 [Tetrapisispora phaffii CBS 4417]|uniref:Uncharacterized protein n=1 Tax=Tetrapisispora phaffii (strain ATCC 24235 / CBS 4417 / NBRC 1672 / NRRL Y-8282 / UCD 70-5) TaxID=1071381 RepID=G8BP31_TETPH|nr:hypothetical protein TPHA_0A05850 [Tetrapisispora phaffii CBS 4417]CCE61659.1 hypothetical protein TPHA_0A05850 [Tetrapisispora phaffii CBS 4417]